MKRELEAGRLSVPDWPWLDPGRKLLVVTAHRRENFGEGIADICSALARLAQRGDVQIGLCGPSESQRDRGRFAALWVPSAISFCWSPQGYVPFVDLMRRAYLLITDSGGIQEEGPSLGKPILVLRKKPSGRRRWKPGRSSWSEPTRNGSSGAAAALLDDREQWAAMARVHNPYGDGQASERIAESILRFRSRHTSQLRAKGERSASIAGILLLGFDRCRNTLVQQQFRRQDMRLGMEVALQRLIEQQVADGEQRHPLMMRHPGSDDFSSLTRIVYRLIKAIASQPSILFHLPENFQCRYRIRVEGQHGGISAK